MAHQLIVRGDGTGSMAYRGETPWHGMGAKLSDSASLEDVLIAVPELRVPVTKEKVFTHDGVEIPGWWCTRRGEHVLGIVGARFTPTQDTDALAYGQQLVSTGKFIWETVGTLFEGARTWFSLSMKCAAEIVKGDILKGYVTFCHAHDGSLSHHFGVTPVRTVCANTEAAARRDSRSVFSRVVHTKKASLELDKIAKILEATEADFNATAEAFQHLATMKATERDLRRLVRVTFFPKMETKAPASKPSGVVSGGIDAVLGAVDIQPTPDVHDLSVDALLGAESLERVYQSVLEFAESGKGTDIPGVRGTMWGAYNAITEYISHGRGRIADNRLNDQLFGGGATQAARALDAALNFGKW